MGQILTFVAIGLTALTAALGFLNQGKIKNAQSQLESQTAALNAKSSALSKAQGDLKKAQEELATATAGADENTTKLAQAQTALEKAKEDTTKLTADVTAKQAEIDKLNADIASKTGGIDPNTPPPVDPKVTADLEAKVAEQQALVAKLEKEMDSKNEELTKFRQVKENQDKRIMQAGLEGQVLAVNNAWNFVILDLGARNGVVNNAEMIVKRGPEMVGKVRITKVNNSSAVADIVTSSVPAGVTIQPYDHVIFQAAD
jgi:multidrug efflux pump subunit AcrA (membrane-fusion protein)